MQTTTRVTPRNKEMSTLTNQSAPSRTYSSGTSSRVIGESSRVDMLVRLTRQCFDLSVISPRIIDIYLYFITVISDWLYRCIQFDIQPVSQSYRYNRVSITYCKDKWIKACTGDMWRKSYNNKTPTMQFLTTIPRNTQSNLGHWGINLCSTSQTTCSKLSSF